MILSLEGRSLLDMYFLFTYIPGEEPRPDGAVERCADGRYRCADSVSVRLSDGGRQSFGRPTAWGGSFGATRLESMFVFSGFFGVGRDFMIPTHFFLARVHRRFLWDGTKKEFAEEE
jgi:hypothetical protein